MYFQVTWNVALPSRLVNRKYHSILTHLTQLIYMLLSLIIHISYSSLHIITIPHTYTLHTITYTHTPSHTHTITHPYTYTLHTHTHHQTPILYTHTHTPSHTHLHLTPLTAYVICISGLNLLICFKTLPVCWARSNVGDKQIIYNNKILIIQQMYTILTD